MEKQWIYELRKRFSNRKTTAPEGLWEGIEATMSRQNVVANSVGKKDKNVRIIPLWLKTVGVAAACLALIIGIWWLTSTHIWEQAKSNKNISENVNTSVVRDKNETVSHEITSHDKVPQGLFNHLKARLSSLISNDDVQETVSYTTSETDIMAEEYTKEDESINKTKEENKEVSTEWQRSVKSKNNGYHPQENYRKENNSSYIAKNHSTSHSKNKKNNVEFDLYGAASTFAGNSSSNYGMSYSSIAMISDKNMLRASNLERSNVSESDENEVNVKHRFPLKVGVSVRFKLTDRWGIETGMVYSYHSSDIMSGDEYSGYKTVRKLHYVGVPLNFNYDIWKNDYLNIYAKCGGMAEFCVSGHATTDYITGNTVTDTSEESVREKRPQWSVDLSPGIQYNFNNTIGVYAEPGIAYYFDNGSGMNTIYKDKKININLNIGLRLTIK
ncbi:MAG: outer membrane beta-barrel protein [Prevotella sp.]|nr:outer membrane beta-barrel protein [Prevotella sp.]